MTKEIEDLAEVLAVLTPRLRTLTGHYRIPLQDGEDLIQDAIIIALTHWPEINQKERWILVTAKNLCIAYHRKQRVWGRLLQSIGDEELQALPNTCSPPQEGCDVILDIRKLAASLGKEHRDIIHLRFFEELGPTELAARIGCHPANIRKILLRILAQLKNAALSPAKLEE